jgi:microcystin-dependent protein
MVTYVNADSSFYLRNMPNPYAIPVGGLLPYVGSSAPNTAFALPSGQTISRTTYSVLFSLISTTFGVGDGSTTFGLPDLRGRAIFGLDNMGGSAASRITVAGGNFDGTAIGTAGGAQNKTIAQANLPAATLTTTITDPGHTHVDVAGTGTGGGNFLSRADSNGNVNYVSNSNTTGITASTALGGSGTALAILPPSMVLPFILRVI